jgi:hypothetical protein
VGVLNPPGTKSSQSATGPPVDRLVSRQIGSRRRPYEISNPAFIQRFGFRITRFGHSLYYISNFFIILDVTPPCDRKVIQHEGVFDLSVFESRFDPRLYFTSTQMRKGRNQLCQSISFRNLAFAELIEQLIH